MKRKFVFSMCFALLAATAAYGEVGSKDYMSLTDLEKKFGIEAGESLDPNVSALLELVKKKVDFKDTKAAKMFSDKVDSLTEKIDDKKLGKAKLKFKRVLLDQKKLAKEAGKAKPTASRLEKYGEDVFEDIKEFGEVLEKSAGSGADKARLEFSEKELQKLAKEAHASLLTEKEYVSATKCQECHPVHFDQWAMSQHAYAQLSPVYMAMQNAINHLTSKTNGDFCIRCHNQVGMNKEEPTFFSNLDRHPASREGITCIVCHRISSGAETVEGQIAQGSLPYGKVSGRMAIQKADIKDIIYGPRPDDEVKSQIDSAGSENIHGNAGQFSQISTSGFCGTCHDVNLFNGFRLEEAFSEYKNSPAAKNGVSCQDCHMGVIQGAVVAGKDKVVGEKNYVYGKIASSSTRDRKMTDHTFSGPDHTVIHPALFPVSDQIVATATARDWIKFDYSAGWGSKRWEDEVGKEGDGMLFKDFWPEGEKLNRWMYRSDRENARKIILNQFKKITEARRKRLQVLKRGYKLVNYEDKSEYTADKMTVTEASVDGGIEFHVGVQNGTDGHNVPTGFIGERLVWISVDVYKDGESQPLFQSGDLDPNGDVRDQHSFFVHGGASRWKIADGKGAQRLLTSPIGITPEDEQVRVKPDLQLFNLQSKFITRNIRGGEREQILAINHSVDTLPFIRPSTRSVVLTGQPAGARIHRLSLPTNATRKVSYSIDEDLLKGPGKYRVEVKFKSAMLPVNLVQAISIVGFDYGMTPKEVSRRVVFGFGPEREAMRYYAIDDASDLKNIVENKEYRERAEKELMYRLKVTTEEEQKKMLDYKCVTYYAEEIAKKKADYVLELFKGLKQGQAWYDSKEFAGIRQNVERYPMDNLIEVKTYLEEQKLTELSKEEVLAVNKIINVIDKNDDMNKYWPESKIRSYVDNGLIIPKVTGHEVLYEVEKTIELK